MGEKFIGSRRNFAVIFCTAMIGIFIGGPATLSGQLFLASMERYNVGRKEAAFPFTLTYIFRTISGPIAGYLGHKYGAQVITEIGCTISVIGMGGCYFAEDITTVSVLWGAVYGIGNGLGSLLLPNILNEVFDKHYDKANGIYMAGFGVGSIVLAPIVEFLLEHYGTSGTFLVITAIALNFLPVSLILRFTKNSFSTPNATNLLPIGNKNKEALHCDSNKRGGVKNHNFTENAGHEELVDRECEKKLLYIDTDRWEEVRHGSRKAKGQAQISMNMAMLQKSHEENSSETTLSESSRCLERANKEFSPGEAHDDEEVDKNLPPEAKGGILYTLSIFVDPAFIIILITQCFSLFNLLTWYTIVIDFARDVGVASNQEVYVLTSLTLSDTLGRALLGAITDKGYLTKDKFYSLSCALLGVTMINITLIEGFPLYTSTIFLIGLLLGGMMMIHSGILIPFIPRDKLIIAMPCRLFLYPILGMAKPFLIDYFRQLQGSYNGLLYSMAAMSVLSAFLTLLLPMAKRLREK